MPVVPFVGVNGKTYDYSSLETTLPGLGIVKEISAINYSDSVERGELRGQAPHVLAFSDGQYSADGSFDIEKQKHTALMTALHLMAAPYGNDIRKVRFPLTVIYGNFGDPLIKDTLIGCAWNGDDQSNSSGSDSLMVTVNLSVQLVKWNGINPLGASALDLGISGI